MKKLTFIISFAFYTVIICAQVTTTKIANTLAKIEVSTYDSLSNFLGYYNVSKYIGQELYLKGMSENSRQYGYSDFVWDYKNTNPLDDKNKYKCCDRNNSKYGELAGKYFNVLGIEKYNGYIYLKIQEKESKDVVYYKYNSEYEHRFPFIVVGYFLKLKEIYIGEEFIVKGKNWIRSNTAMVNMHSGSPVSNFDKGDTWKCVDVTIEEEFFKLAFVLENNTGEQIPISVDQALTTRWILPEKYAKKIDDDKWKLILDEKVAIGMTKEMCRLAWGEPKEINETITASGKTEQWIYNGNYLYFDKGILIAIQ